jgi:NAD(P)H-nitrite reductase large subunit
MKVTVIEKMERLMPLQLDAVASDILLQATERQGIDVCLNTEVLALENKAGRVTGVCIRERIIPADLVLVTIGVKPNLEMTTETALERDRGLLTNEYMQTNISGIYAAGDVVQSFCQLSGKKVMRALWLSAVQQGKVAGANMAGREERYAGTIALNSIQLFGLSIISQGQIEAINGIEGKILKYSNSGLYQKIFYQKGKLEGFILVGDVQQAGVLHHKLGQPLYTGYWGKVRVLEEDEILA